MQEVKTPSIMATMKTLPVQTEVTHLDPAATLKAAGITPTDQRVLLFSLLLQKDYHPTADELEADANKVEKVSTTTVYISLRHFLLAGLLHSFVDRGGKIRYGGYPKPHAHSLCVVCGRTRDVEYASLPQILPPGWAPGEVQPLLVVYGYCTTCRHLKPQLA